MQIQLSHVNYVKLFNCVINIIISYYHFNRLFDVVLAFYFDESKSVTLRVIHI